MQSAISTFLRWSLPLGALALGCRLLQGCASTPEGEIGCTDDACGSDGLDGGQNGGGDDATLGASDGGGGTGNQGSNDAGAVDDRGYIANPDTGAHVGNADSGGTVPPADAGDWINMTNNADGCHDLTGVPCGYGATNDMLGWTCACREGTWAEPYTCAAPGTCVSLGSLCPAPAAGTPICDAGTGTSDGGASLLDAGGPVDAGGWVNMNNGPTSCDDQPNVPCGWNATNNDAGYTCACREGTWADGWTCELAGSAVTPGSSCPDAG